MAIRFLINDNGQPFQSGELDALVKELDSLTTEERTKFRNANAQNIARNTAKRILIVAGPGTGKSAIFKQRVLFWLEKEPVARILALSFVRKLVADLNSDIQNDQTLSDDQKSQVDVYTLHKYARSIVEQNGGTREWPLTPHFRIIAQSWKDIVWDDVLLLAGQENGNQYSWEHFEKQLHEAQFSNSTQWKRLRQTYFALCGFYNAAGFADLILRASDALAENPALNQHQFFLIDEYQDFNASEQQFLERITQAAKGTLMVGDDDQVLYEKLKSGRPSLIRAVYNDTNFVNAMLAFCGRCSFHITRAASHFIRQAADADSIKKIYLPISTSDASQKIQIIGCATPTTAVDYIRKFIEDHTDAIEQRKKELEIGDSKDPYLLILSPSAALKFYSPNDAKKQLFDVLRPHIQQQDEFSEDYYKILSYYSLADYPSNNFTFRKVLYYEKTSREEVATLLSTCTTERKLFAAIEHNAIAGAMAKTKVVRDILNSKTAPEAKVESLTQQIELSDPAALLRDLRNREIDKEHLDAIEYREEEDAELQEIRAKPMSAIELLSFVGAKGLSADHVIILGFDDVNMGWVTGNAFFVAMTRARQSLHVLTALKAGRATRPHHFVDRLPDQNLEFSSYTKKRRAREHFSGRRRWIEYLSKLRAQGRRRK
jgi:superfamily I DNA/RNA helicase